MTKTCTERGETLAFDDDDTYLAWVNTHPEGYILTSNKSLTPRHTVIHRTTCDKIKVLSGNAQPGGFTRQYIKVYGQSVADLQSWALKKRSDAEYRECTLCAGK